MGLLLVPAPLLLPVLVPSLTLLLLLVPFPLFPLAGSGDVVVPFELLVARSLPIFEPAMDSAPCTSSRNEPAAEL